MISHKAIKFPLKMKNGAQVRSLEELRTNADVESIMNYYFSGQLVRWCKAFGINELPECINQNNIKFVYSVMSMFNITEGVNQSDIERYVTEKFGNNTVPDIVSDVEEVVMADDKSIKEKLLSMVDDSINLNDYLIEVAPIKDDKGKIQKYRVCINNEKNDQYSRFSVSYELEKQYTHELFEQDLYRKLKYALESLEEAFKFNLTKNETIGSLKVGDIFDFGFFEGKRIKWKVLRKDNASLYAITTESLCNRKFDRNSNNWSNSEIRKWLNGDFYNSSFTADEKEKIITVNNDNVTLLSKEETEQLMIQKERKNDSCWWLRSASPNFSPPTCYVYNNITRNINYVIVSYEEGVRPALNFKI
ncbi:DUF6273 domain-containing protein [Ruminococcus sp. HUN007]|uniref:DUF6273 domain-containing protein n=1 Tax=Ruminococcus sp. HUN007 TaxID=1514668 RepID=UPI0005D14A52|nr:DUF6273 domain-containing protein [Ruminococcus sp. HUN007]